MFNSFTVRDRLLFSGNAFMLATCLLYIAWWTSAFRPGSRSAKGLSSVLLLGTVLVGIAAVVQFVRGIRLPGENSPLVPVGLILAGAVVLYIVLYAVGQIVFHRPVTTELFIMVLWAAGELCALLLLHADGRFGIAVTVVLLLFIIAATVTGFVCYLKYYHLSGMASFIDGLVPLASDAVVILIFLILHSVS